MKTKIEIELNCENCPFYVYIKCTGYDCSNPNAPSEELRGDEPLAENKDGDMPKWCPLLPEER